MAVQVGTRISYSHLETALNNLNASRSAHCPANYTSYNTSHDVRVHAFYSSHLNGYDLHYTSWNASWRTANYARHYSSWESDVCDKLSVVYNNYNANQYKPVEDNYYPSNRSDHGTHYRGYNSVTYAHHSGHDSYNKGHCTGNYFDKSTYQSNQNAGRYTQYSTRYTQNSTNYGHNASYYSSNRNAG